MAGIAAANASVFEIPEKEGRLRWQAKWHELEQQARSADLRLSPVGTDRTGASYYVVAPWGQVAVQPSGGGAVKRVKGSTAASEVNKKRKKPKTETGDANDANDDDDDDDDNNDLGQPQGPDGSTRDENAHLPEEKPWGMYQGVEGLGALAASLNKRGFREGTLWSELERRFGAAPVPCEEAPVKVESRIVPEGAEGDVEMKEPEEPEKDEDNAQKAMAPIGAVRAVPAPPADANGWKAPSPAGAAVDTPEATIAAIRDEILALDAALPRRRRRGQSVLQSQGVKGAEGSVATHGRDGDVAPDPRHGVRAARGVVEARVAVTRVVAVVAARDRAALGVAARRRRRRRVRVFAGARSPQGNHVGGGAAEAGPGGDRAGADAQPRGARRPTGRSAGCRADRRGHEGFRDGRGHVSRVSRR
jgi:hypothetical protein